MQSAFLSMKQNGLQGRFFLINSMLTSIRHGSLLLVCMHKKLFSLAASRQYESIFSQRRNDVKEKMVVKSGNATNHK